MCGGQYEVSVDHSSVRHTPTEPQVERPSEMSLRDHADFDEVDPRSSMHVGPQIRKAAEEEAAQPTGARSQMSYPAKKRPRTACTPPADCMYSDSRNGPRFPPRITRSKSREVADAAAAAPVAAPAAARASARV